MKKSTLYDLFARVWIDFMQRIKIKYFHSEQSKICESKKDCGF
jgi:hypothetical protein